MFKTNRYGNRIPRIDQLCKYLNLKKSNLYLKVEIGEMPHYRFGRLIRFKKEDVDLWIEGHRREKADPKVRVKEILKTMKRPSADIDSIVKKAIDGLKETRYTTPGYGRPGQGLGKEVEDGTV